MELKEATIDYREGDAELSALQRRERRLGAGAIQQTESDWSQLIAMLELAQRWQELIGEFTGEDADPDGAGADDLCSGSRVQQRLQTQTNFQRSGGR